MGNAEKGSLERNGFNLNERVLRKPRDLDRRTRRAAAFAEELGVNAVHIKYGPSKQAMF